jgi:protein phosphatase 2C family protein 2/3
MSTKDVVNTVWNSYTKNIKNVHDFTGKAIENVMRLSLQRKSFDNVTVVFVAFSALEKYINYKK